MGLKSWLKNLKIKNKLNLMIAISLLGLVLLGLTSNFLIRSTKVVSIMLAAQREYMVEYHRSLEYYYQYTADQSQPALLDSAIYLLENANKKVELFTDLDEFFTKPKKEQLNSIVLVYKNAISGGSLYADELGKPILPALKNAKLLYSRFHAMHRLNLAVVKKSTTAAFNSLKSAQEILGYYERLRKNPNESRLNSSELGSLLNSMKDNESEYQAVVGEISNKITGTLGLLILLIVVLIGSLIFSVSKLISGMIAVPVNLIGGHLKSMAHGMIPENMDYQSKDEIGQLSDSFRTMRNNLINQIEQAQKVAEGNFESLLRPQSEKDAMSYALNHMTHSLREADRKNKHDNWIKTNQNKLSETLRGDLDLQSLGSKTTAFLCEELHALTGVLFTRNDDGNLIFSGGHAIIKDLAERKVFKPGDGIVGQAFQFGEFRLIEDIPDEYLNITTGLGTAKPRYLMIQPCLFNGEVFGVLEIASLRPFDEMQMELLQKVAESIAIAISSAKSRTELQQLLVKSQKLSEELQVQQEELRQTNEELQVQQEELRQANEELEAQTRELEESKASLQAQQEELRVTNEELAERTKAIESQRDSIRAKNEELETARKEILRKARDLEQASRYKSEFMANMSHELRTPLNSILVLSQILSQNKPNNLTEKQIKSAETIHSSGENLLVLINEILDLSKIESGRIDLHPEFVNLDALVKELSESFSPLAEERGLNLILSNNLKEIESFETDSLRTGQILKNLLSNAIKFTESGRVELKISRPENLPENLDPQRSYISFAVSDTGIGIDADKLDLVFDAFKQADGTTTRKFGGTGLGLAISRNFAQLMGGEISLISEKGNGSTFTLLLPEKMHLSKTAQMAIKAANTVSANYPEPEPDTLTESAHAEQYSGAPDAPDPEYQGGFSLAESESIQDDRKHISKGDTFLLIIEDDPAFSQVLYDLAHEKHFKCMIAPNGESGLHYADYYGPSAIILDIGLPGIDGWEVMKRLKENPNTRHIPVHFMSASDKSMEAMKRGAIGFLKKPVSVEDVFEALEGIEGLISKPVKKLLIVEDDEIMRQSILQLLGEDDIQITLAGKGMQALDLLKTESFDCMILDLGLEDMTGYELLQQMGKKGGANKMPVIIYTGKDLTREEEAKLQAYTDRIIIKGVKSPDRLLAETTLFLHQIESNLPKAKQQMLRNFHSSGDVMKDKTILIVDDDMRNVFALTSLLEDLGVKIIVGKNGKDGIEKLENNSTDLILMDIMMPEMNGYEAMQLIRKKKKYDKLPIIALTAKAMPGDREKCIESGANDYLTKPIDPDKLISMLRVWLYQ